MEVPIQCAHTPGSPLHVNPQASSGTSQAVVEAEGPFLAGSSSSSLLTLIFVPRSLFVFLS